MQLEEEHEQKPIEQMQIEEPGPQKRWYQAAEEDEDLEINDMEEEKVPLQAIEKRKILKRKTVEMRNRITSHPYIKNLQKAFMILPKYSGGGQAVTLREELNKPSEE